VRFGRDFDAASVLVDDVNGNFKGIQAACCEIMQKNIWGIAKLVSPVTVVYQSSNTQMFAIDASSIDRSLPVPVGKQLHGLLSYMLSFGDMPRGVKLQSVRQLAAELDIAPMTVAEVYKQLRADGLVEIRPGLGAFTVYEPRRRDGVLAPASVLSPDIDSLLEKAEGLGISPITLASMVQAPSFVNRASILRSSSWQSSRRRRVTISSRFVPHSRQTMSSRS
jgi:DNA-binding transcriptional regulator YhcF (GntR family)